MVPGSVRLSMQDLGAEICKFGRFVEVKVPYGRCAFYHAWVVIVHAIYIGPYLDFFRADDRAYQRCAVVASSALQIVHLRMEVAADKALGKIYVRLFLE